MELGNLFSILGQRYKFTNMIRDLPEFDWIYEKKIDKGHFGSVALFENEFGERIAVKEQKISSESSSSKCSIRV